MTMFQKATKQRRKLRAAVFGPSGSGKTFSSIAIASGLGSKIALIDTERGSASLYSDQFDFDVCDLEDRTINGYCQVIRGAASAGYDVLVIDSLTHAWQELLQEVDKIASAKYRGNTWSAWSEGTPKQRQLIDSILDFPGHVIATMRSKTEWTTEKDSRTGKDRPVRVGLAPEQGKGIEYEFDLLLELSVDHVVNVIKDRTGKFQDRKIEKPGHEFGGELMAWLQNAALPEQHPRPTLNGHDRDALQAAAVRKLKDCGVTAAGMNAMLAELGGEGCRAIGQLPDDLLINLAKAKVTPETLKRWNSSAEKPAKSVTVRREAGSAHTAIQPVEAFQQAPVRARIQPAAAGTFVLHAKDHIDPAPPAVQPQTMNPPAETVEPEPEVIEDDEPMLWAGGDE